MTTGKMTKGERDSLLSLMKQRERVLKTMATQRALEMMAEFERNISAVYKFDTDEVWKEAKEFGEKAISEAQTKIRDRCIELGIPEEFRPSLQAYWNPRGDNAWPQRRAELRRVAKAEIEAVEQKARGQIEQISVEAQTQIISHGLESAAAQQFFQNMPSVEKLMPSIEVHKIEHAVQQKRMTLQ